MTDAQFKVAFKLRSIPQRNAHFMCLHGDDVAIGLELVAAGWAVESSGFTPDEKTFRLNKPGRERLVVEWVKRGRPTRKEISGDG
jgi:hypothetical protein